MVTEIPRYTTQGKAYLEAIFRIYQMNNVFEMCHTFPDILLVLKWAPGVDFLGKYRLFKERSSSSQFFVLFTKLHPSRL